MSRASNPRDASMPIRIFGSPAVGHVFFSAPRAVSTWFYSWWDHMSGNFVVVVDLERERRRGRPPLGTPPPCYSVSWRLRKRAKRTTLPTEDFVTAC
jgi:hypothetical protein